MSINLKMITINFFFVIVNFILQSLVPFWIYCWVLLFFFIAVSITHLCILFSLFRVFFFYFSINNTYVIMFALRCQNMHWLFIFFFFFYLSIIQYRTIDFAISSYSRFTSCSRCFTKIKKKKQTHQKKKSNNFRMKNRGVVCCFLLLFCLLLVRVLGII